MDIERLTSRLPETDRESITGFLNRAIENGLSHADFYTINDLQEEPIAPSMEITVLLTALFLALSEGSVCIELSPAAIMERLAGVLDAEQAPRLIAAALGAIEQNRLSALINIAAPDAAIPIDKPLVLRRNCGTSGRSLLYFQKYLRHEDTLKVRLTHRLNQLSTSAPTALQTRVFSSVIAAHTSAEKKFSDEQKLAIALAMLRNFVVISGGPGTGKTSVVVAILDCLIRTGTPPDRIMLACPTGRAAQRLTESVRAGAAGLGGDGAALSALEGETLHRMLGYNAQYGNFRHHRENPIPADVLVIDEVSMMDVVLMSHFLEAAAPNARIILLGDKDQLPSVDAGSVLADMMPVGGRGRYSQNSRANLKALSGVEIPPDEGSITPMSESIVALTRNYRSQKQITGIAQSINALSGDGAAEVIERIPTLKLQRHDQFEQFVWPALESLRQEGKAAPGGCYRLAHPHVYREWRDILDAWGRHHYLHADQGKEASSAYSRLITHSVLPNEAELDAALLARIASIFAVINGARVLTLIREGPWGCVGVNEHLAQLVRSQIHVGRNAAGRLFPGAPVLITSNDYSHQLYNGDVGVALRSEGGGLRVVFERQDQSGRRTYAALPAATLPAHELAFAMTVHKSQGSEYGQVLLALPEKGAQRLQNRQLVYTALTRAKHLAVCYGTAETLKSAITRSLDR